MSRLQWEGPAVERKVWRSSEYIKASNAPDIYIVYEIESYDADKLYTVEARKGSKRGQQIAIGDFDNLEEAKEWIEESVDEWIEENDIK